MYNTPLFFYYFSFMSDIDGADNKFGSIVCSMYVFVYVWIYIYTYI